MAYRVATDAAAAVGKLASRQVRPCPATRPSAQQTQLLTADATISTFQRRAASIMLSAGLVCGQILVPEQVMATIDMAQAPPTSATAAPSSRSPLLPMLLAAPPPLASAATSASLASGAALVVEAEELALDAFHFLQHGVEAVGSKVHHLQMVHALERLEGMTLNQVVDLELLKAAIHPALPDASEVEASEADGGDVGDDNDVPSSSSSSSSSSAHARAALAAAARLDSALDEVSELPLREVLDVRKLADALQDVQYSGPLNARALQREALRLRRSVHWEVVAEAVRPEELRGALSALGAVHSGDSPFSELDIRAALSAVRMDAVRQVLTPPKSPRKQAAHSLDSSGMWTWEM